jgi:hypothetical protein
MFAMAVAAFHDVLGLDLEAVWPLVTAATGYNVGQGIADHGKSVELLKMKDTQTTITNVIPQSTTI